MSLTPDLRVGIFWIAVVLCVIAELAILRSMLRGSRAGAVSAPAPETSVPRGRPIVEMVWAIIPAVALVVVLILTRNAIR